MRDFQIKICISSQEILKWYNWLVISAFSQQKVIDWETIVYNCKHFYATEWHINLLILIKCIIFVMKNLLRRDNSSKLYYSTSKLYYISLYYTTNNLRQTADLLKMINRWLIVCDKWFLIFWTNYQLVNYACKDCPTIVGRSLFIWIPNILQSSQFGDFQIYYYLCESINAIVVTLCTWCQDNLFTKH